MALPSSAPMVWQVRSRDCKTSASLYGRVKEVKRGEDRGDGATEREPICKRLQCRAPPPGSAPRAESMLLFVIRRRPAFSGAFCWCLRKRFDWTRIRRMMFTVTARLLRERDTAATARGKAALQTTRPIQFSTTPQALLPVPAKVGEAAALRTVRGEGWCLK